MDWVYDLTRRPIDGVRKEAVQLPTCIKATRIGHHSYGSESGYDAFGEAAPVTWMCACGNRLTLEWFDDEDERYVPVSQERKASFLEQHSNCAIVCYKCHEVAVERPGYWCESCEESVTFLQ
jgi:hypothetical protein